MIARARAAVISSKNNNDGLTATKTLLTLLPYAEHVRVYTNSGIVASQFSSYSLDIINVYNQDLFVLQEVLKQLQSKLEQEAGTLASSGRSDILHQLKGLHLPQGIPFCCN